MKPRNADYQKERGYRQEERILAAIADEAKTTRQLAAELHISRASVAVYLRRLTISPIKHVHIERYEMLTTGRPTPFYRGGTKPDAVFQAIYVRKDKQPDRRTARIMQILELLIAPKAAADLAPLMTITISGTRRYLQELRADKRIYIKSWRHPGKRGDWAPVYMIGNKPDAPKPKETRAERHAKDKADADKYERILAKRRAASRVKTATSKPSNWLSALGL